MRQEEAMKEKECGEGTWVIGLDWATQENARGLALGCVDTDNHLVVHKVERASKRKPTKEIVGSWLGDGKSALICIDAPLGWPIGLSRALWNHDAGCGIGTAPDTMFSRFTDTFVAGRLGKKPLEVGADLIARAALSAVQFLGLMRGPQYGLMPLPWNDRMINETSVIEVYPAATLCAWGIDPTGYKGNKGRSAREVIFDRIADVPKIDCRAKGVRNACCDKDHYLDAVLCLLAGRDFLARECLKPSNDIGHLIEKEGWIWVRDPEYSKTGNPCKKADT